jgi:hypothetical protein
MCAAHELARAALGVQPDQDAREAWGWHGRTLGSPVITPAGPAWLRVASAPAGQPATIFWDGSVEAEKSMPRSVPRPWLRSWHDWTDQRWKYRAELYERVADRPAAASPILATAPDLSRRWWTAARAALAAIEAVPTRRVAVRQSFLDQAMPRLLGTPISTSSPRPWTTAHGDFHFANLCAPNLHVLDFEGWGLAPPDTTQPRCTPIACSSPKPPLASAASSRTYSTPPQAGSLNSSSSPSNSTPSPAPTPPSPKRSASAPRSSCHP